ncbi:MAG TPA: 50S ribosomal protein L11 methyltransferase [Solirubrobacteraceae bacterium]|nr:50S ribosomal protein L11 methyltransferase [Solirubrobacteraceae bacterium]
MIRLAVRVRSDDAEIVLAELLELAPGGVEEVSPAPGLVEFAVYGSPGELPQLPAVRAAVGEALVEVSSSNLDDDWAERWKLFHKPVTIDSPSPGRVPSLYVRPPWEPPSGRAGMLEIAIDPGRAFGTGAHATTRLCLELLLELTAQRPQTMLHPARGIPNPLVDLGTGSGVLAIAASGLGYRPVWALDNDPDSVAAAGENAQANAAEIHPRLFDLRHEQLPRPRAAVVLANLVRPLLLQLASGLGDRPPQHLIAGGLLVAELDEVSGVFARAGLAERDRRCGAEWGALWLQADARAR